MTGQVNIFLLLFGGLQGVLLSVLLIKKQSFRTGYGFLLAYLLVLIAQVLLKVLSKTWLMDHIELWYFLSYKLPLLYGPLVFLFTRNVLQQQRSRSAGEALHFLPFVVAAGTIFFPNPYLASGVSGFLWYGASGTALQVMSLLVYHYYALRQWQRHYGQIKDDCSDAHLLRMQWLRQLIGLSALVTTSISLLLYFMYSYYPGMQFLRWGFVLLSIFIYWISYPAISQPVLFAGTVTGDREAKAAPVVTIPPKLVVHKKAEKYANTGLKEEEASRILADVEAMMLEQKSFLDPAITIDKLAALVHTNRHCLSQVLNERAGKSFYDYINEYRVNEAKRLLLDEQYLNQKIAGVAYDAGFNSLSAFNEVFKKTTGSTPSQFRKSRQSLFGEQRG